MRTARLSGGGGGVIGPNVNNFEQFSGDDH